MQFFLIGLVLLLLLLAMKGKIESMDPKATADRLRKTGGMAALAGAVTLLALGRLGLAIPLALLGMSLLGWRFMIQIPQGRGSARRSPGQTSSVKTEYLEMHLDHDSRQMEGRVLKGTFAGRALSSLSLDELLALLSEAGPRDPQSARLIEGYLDRVAPDWRTNARARGAGAGAGPPAGAGMSSAEAYQILGLPPGASAEDIRRAHRELMKKFHPDQGGSTYLAMKINEAKETLLREGV